MPLWSIIYAALLVLSALFTIFISPNRSIHYIIGELSSGIFALLFFLFHYHIVPYPPSVITPLLMLGFILFQEIWVNRELYHFISLQNVPEEEHRWMLFFIPMMTILFLSPFIWIVSQVFRHYFSPL